MSKPAATPSAAKPTMSYQPPAFRPATPSVTRPWPAPTNTAPQIDQPKPTTGSLWPDDDESDDDDDDDDMGTDEAEDSEDSKKESMP